tara:strand:- start:17018 stop:17494 length:477 start_codon:yes stop_codon:yes gene_type:complete
MNPQDALSALQPLREPANIGWWPPAPGWWMLALLILLLVTAAAWILYRHWRRRAYRRRALHQLRELRANHARHADVIRYTTELNALLKRVALDAYARDDLAAASGEAWETFLNESAPDGPRFDAGFTQAVYRNDSTSLCADSLHAAARHWLRYHRVPA